MQKVYLLLRNNQQTGPYTFEELLALHLKPNDLIWVEGKSYGWRYPAEVESLKPYVATPETPQPQKNESLTQQMPASAPELHRPRTVFVSMPVAGSSGPEPVSKATDVIEQKAEELRKRAMSFTPQEEPVRTNYTRDLHEAEEDYTKWIYQKKTKKKSFLNKKSMSISVVCLLLIAGGWWLSKQFTGETSQAAHQSFVPPDTTKETPAEITSAIETENLNIPPLTTSSTTRTAAEKENPSPAITNRNKIAGKGENIELHPQIQNDPVERTIGDNTATEEKQEEPVAEIPAENKKTLKEKISDLFRRKNGEPSSETATPADKNESERKSTHRGEENVDPPVMVDVSSEVEVKTNKIADSWMLGVKGLKLTLYNRSNLTINTAKVEILYFSDQDILLDRKTLSYSNIAPKKSQAVSAPDHRMADHIQFKVLSATGIENAYANK